jgi:serine protease inhibitor
MPWPFSHKPAVVADAVETSPSAGARFAFKLLRELARENQVNVFFSPSSVMLCLTMVHELASGETRADMAKALEVASLDASQLAAERSLS